MEEENLAKVNLSRLFIIFTKQIFEQSTDAAGTLVVNADATGNTMIHYSLPLIKKASIVHYADGTIAEINPISSEPNINYEMVRSQIYWSKPVCNMYCKRNCSQAKHQI